MTYRHREINSRSHGETQRFLRKNWTAAHPRNSAEKITTVSTNDHITHVNVDAATHQANGIHYHLLIIALQEDPCH
jgi:hypothetical protein